MTRSDRERLEDFEHACGGGWEKSAG